MVKSLKLKIFIISTLIILISISIFVSLNFYKFYSKYFKYSWEYTKNNVAKKNLDIIKKQNQGKIFFEKDEYNFIKIPLGENGLVYSDEYSYRPIGYIDIFEDKIIFASHDGNFYFSNKISEIKKGKFNLNKIEQTNFDFKFDFDDKLSFRSILIRDILVHNKNLYVVITGRNTLKDDEYSASPIVLKGNLDLTKNEIKFEKFFDSNELIMGIRGYFSHTGGRIVKYTDNNFLLTVPDHALKDDFKAFHKRLKSPDSIIGKIIILNEKKYEIFSYGHRNPQGLFYDSDEDLIFETEHGPTGGDEINLIKKGNHYGWPVATYGAIEEGFTMTRNHKKNGFTEPLAYWWPINCGISQIIKINNSFNVKWKKYNLLNACLTGSGFNQGESIYRWQYDLKKEKLIKKNQYHIGDRIRDMKYSSKFETIFLLLEDQKSIALIFK